MASSKIPPSFRRLASSPKRLSWTHRFLSILWLVLEGTSALDLSTRVDHQIRSRLRSATKPVLSGEILQPWSWRHTSRSPGSSQSFSVRRLWVPLSAEACVYKARHLFHRSD